MSTNSEPFEVENMIHVVRKVIRFVVVEHVRKDWVADSSKPFATNPPFHKSFK
jgi:hypothetical protein